MCMALASFARLEYSLTPLALTNAVLYGGVETEARGIIRISHSFLEMSEPSRPVCEFILGVVRRGPNSWKGSSLEDSARCGCHYCSAVCESRPEMANQDPVEVRLLKNSLWVSYTEHFVSERDGNQYRRSLTRELFSPSSKLASVNIDRLSDKSVASNDPNIPQAKDITGDTGSRQSFELIRGWLDTCLDTHKSLCSTSHTMESGPKLPDRVIEVGLGTPRRIRLIDTGNRRARYACLSHCWGGQHPLQTTVKPDTLSAHLKGIEEQTLPRTFRDAVTVVLELGIRFIWIDSLCVWKSHSFHILVRIRCSY